jgi:hypothetical protein
MQEKPCLNLISQNIHISKNFDEVGISLDSEVDIMPGRHKHRRKASIKMNLKETGSGDMDWIHLAQDRK